MSPFESRKFIQPRPCICRSHCGRSRSFARSKLQRVLTRPRHASARQLVLANAQVRCSRRIVCFVEHVVKFTAAADLRSLHWQSPRAFRKPTHLQPFPDRCFVKGTCWWVPSACTYTAWHSRCFIIINWGSRLASRFSASTLAWHGLEAASWSILCKFLTLRNGVIAAARWQT